MFIPALEGQADDKQKDKWLPMCRSYKVIGTYAQTELGHGSNVRGLETTATFDKSKDEFIVHTPCLTAIKWWPGNMAKTANHALVMAQLIIDGKKYGVHGFIVQLRDFETHKVRAGIEVGDIGPKFGINMVDNGFLKLNHVRIPRENMLMRFAKVDADGTFSKPNHSKLSYGTMVFVRATIVDTCYKYIARAVTIAVRYSIVRRQFEPAKNQPETQIIDYQTQQFKLFPLLAAAYGMFFVGKEMMRLYQLNNEKLQKDDVSLLPELHALTSGWKALTTEIACAGIEVARRSLGGHGYMVFSGVINLFQDWVSSQTYEGENTILYLQTARYLLKSLQRAVVGKKITGSVSYLGERGMAWVEEKCAAKSPADFSNPSVILHAFQHRAGRMILTIAQALQQKISEGADLQAATGSFSVDLVSAARAHSMYTLLKTYSDSVEKLPETTSDLVAVKQILRKLFILMGSYYIETESGDFLYDGYMNGKHVQMVTDLGRDLLSQIRPEAVALVDGFDFHDHFLNSALGRYDGKVYSALLEWARESPLNNSDIGPGVKEFLLPTITHGGEVRIVSRM
eukprot:TRINITY_DN2514_c0_g1_i2.p1 TRINITY_DN2514_c0_g1~~TRINITY_DN2514_c0_g1_i2.p1  ORF type:complete len:569 (+),score=167.08 TRINITY_DN2514_c0_g1_i2:69-1775(+)